MRCTRSPACVRIFYLQDYRPDSVIAAVITLSDRQFAMEQLTLEQARDLIEQEWAKWRASPYEHTDCVITGSEEREWGWVIYYDSLKHLESGKDEDLLVGGGPYFANKFDGEVFVTGSGKSTEEYLAEYESQIAAGIPNPNIYPQESMFKRIFERLIELTFGWMP